MLFGWARDDWRFRALNARNASDLGMQIAISALAGGIYAILFEAAAETLRTIAACKKHLRAEIGATMVLHMWRPPTIQLRANML